MFQFIKDWWNFRGLTKEFNKEVDENVNLWSNRESVEVLQEDQEIQQKYFNGIALMKQRIKTELQDQDVKEAMSKYKGGKDFYVGRDLLTLAKDENVARKRQREAKEAALVYRGADVKTEADKVSMIDKRIEYYYELHSDKEKRELSRAIRKALKEENITEYEFLKKKWKAKYEAY